jgi:hypothetical protein
MRNEFTKPVVTNRLNHKFEAKKYRGFFTSVYTLGEELPPDCRGNVP